MKVLLSAFGGRRTTLVSELQIPGAHFAQDPAGVMLLVDPKTLPERRNLSDIEPLSKVLFETLDALDATGLTSTQVGEIATFPAWSVRKVQVSFDSAPLAALEVIADSLIGRPVKLKVPYSERSMASMRNRATSFTSTIST